jgi:hypothetical protein
MVIPNLGQRRRLFNYDIELIAQRAAVQEKRIGLTIASNDKRIYSGRPLIHRKRNSRHCFSRVKPRRTVNLMLYPIANSLNFAS